MKQKTATQNTHNLWHAVPAGNAAGGRFNVIIEIPKESRVKYELDKETGLIKFDRVLYSPMHYPANYGFVPHTLWDDGDPIDVLVLAHEPFIPGCLVEARPLGLLPMKDGGKDDVKILAVPVKDPRFAKTRDLSDVEPHILEEIRHFFMVYKDLQKKTVSVGHWQKRVTAEKAIRKSLKKYQEKFGPKK